MGRVIDADNLPAGTPVDQFGFPVVATEEVKPEPETSVQRILGGYMAVEGKPGWYTREMTLRQEIELADMAEELQAVAAASPKPSQVMRAAIPIAQLILFRRNADGDMIPASEDDLLDSFKAKSLMEIVRAVSGFGAQEADPTSSPPDYRLIFCRLTERWGWTFEQVADLRRSQWRACFWYLGEYPAPYTVPVSFKE